MDSKTSQNGTKMVSKDFQLTQNGTPKWYPGNLNVHENQDSQPEVDLTANRDEDELTAKNTSAKSAVNLLGAGGRGEALRTRPHPAGCEGRANSTDAVPVSSSGS